MANVRLAASRDEFYAQEKEHGTQAGEEWSKTTASFRELLKLQKMVEEEAEINAYNVACTILDNYDPNDAYDFWKQLADEGNPDESLVEAFVDAAVAELLNID